MLFYNKVMQMFWLLAAIGIAGYVSYMSYTDGIKKWGYYYIFAVLALIMYLMRRWMMKRMQRHMEFLAQKEQNDRQK
ncbi:MAG: hypothetical protein V4638_01790 [Bacteroidota bacterium]